MKTLKDFDLQGKRVLLRVDFNVPLSNQNRILEDFRVRQTIPTIEYLIKNGAKIIIMSHLGDPEGQVIESMRLGPVQQRLAELLEIPVAMAPDCIGPEVEAMIKEMDSGEMLFLENLRFHKGEEENDEQFADELAKLGDIFINDAFGVCHRDHASITGLAKRLPSGAGLVLEKEITTLTNFMANPAKPLIAVIGGKKVETKSKVINKISDIADFVFINGPLEREVKEKGIKFIHPEKIIAPLDETEGKDIGEKTISLFKEKVKTAKTIFWNGPFGLIEDERFKKGTEEMAKIIAESPAYTVIGGGETVEFVNKMNLIPKFKYVSTGGGAMLNFLSGEKLPGIEALK